MSIGLLFELPWSHASNSRVAVGCSIQALWASGSVARSKAGNWHVSTNMDYPFVRSDLSPGDPLTAKFYRFIDLRPDWLALLTPPVPDPPPTPDSWVPNTLEKIFYDARFDSIMQRLRTESQYLRTDDGGCAWGQVDSSLTDHALWNYQLCRENGMAKVAFVERVLARLVSDGLSRRYSYIPFRMEPSLENWQDKGTAHASDYPELLLKGDPKHNAIILPQNSQFVVQRAEISVEGYGYWAATWSDKMATGVVATYLFFSISHVIWTLSYKRIASSSWDTALELLLLAYNSSPMPALRGTSAQIGRWHTYRKFAKVRVEEQDDPAVVNGKQFALRLILDEVLTGQGQSTPATNGSAIGISSSSVGGSALSRHDVGNYSHLKQIQVDEKYI